MHATLAQATGFVLLKLVAEFSAVTRGNNGQNEQGEIEATEISSESEAERAGAGEPEMKERPQLEEEKA